MAALVETSIWLAIKEHVELIPLMLPIAWPGETFEVPHSDGLPQPYLRVGRVSTDPTGVLIAYGEPHRRTGAVIVTLVYPLGQDISVYDQMAATIAAHFVDGTCMRYGGVLVTVPDYPHVQEGYEDNGYWTVPVRIPWETFA